MNELFVRTATGLLLIAVALIAAVIGGTIFAVFVAAIATAIYYEWSRIVRGWGGAWFASGFVYALLPALSLLWIRERTPPDFPNNETGLALLVWTFIVTWSTDIGAYFTGRRFGRRKLAPAISPGRRSKGCTAASPRQLCSEARGCL